MIKALRVTMRVFFTRCEAARGTKADKGFLYQEQPFVCFYMPEQSRLYTGLCEALLSREIIYAANSLASLSWLSLVRCM